jgi:hypothetical protein
MSAEMAPEVAAAASDEQHSDDPLEIVLELDPGRVDLHGSRAEQIARQKASFQNLAGPVRAAVLQSGGTIESEAWVNGTIKARVPAKALRKLHELDGVSKIDVPHKLIREDRSESS